MTNYACMQMFTSITNIPTSIAQVTLKTVNYPLQMNTMKDDIFELRRKI